MTEIPSEQELNAYVDGELSPQDIARIARAAAGDASIAARIASLTRLKSAMADIADQPATPIDLPRPRRPWRMVATAASFGALLVIGAVLLRGIAPYGSGSMAWFEEARAEHIAWAGTPADPAAREVDANLFLASVQRIALPVQTPDLSSANLRLTYLKFYEATRTIPPAMHLGYTGRHGCKLTLWVTTAAESLGRDLVEFRLDSVRGFRWRVGEIAYALFATGMAERRFTVIAHKVYESTRQQRGLDDNARLALKSASTGQPPCAT